MDSSFTVKPPRPGASRLFAPRDPVPVREAVETDLEAEKTIAASSDGGARHGAGHGAGQHDNDKSGEHRTEHSPQDVVVDPASREVIYRERDVRTAEGSHPDQALLRERAYRQTQPDADRPQPAEPHANIKA